MNIRRIKIQRFKKFSDINIEFDKGINVIVGDNEAGKSTLTKAILDIMYLDPKSKAKGVIDTRKWGEGELGFMGMDFDDMNGEHSLVKDLSKGDVSLRVGNKNITSQILLSEYFKNISGIGSSSMYINTAYISNKDIALINNPEDLIEAIRNVAVEGGDRVSISKIINETNKKLGELNKGIGRRGVNPGIIMKLRDEINLGEQELEKMKDVVSGVNDNNRKLIDLKQDVKRLELEKEAIDNIINVNDRIREAREKYDISVNKIEEMNKRIERVKGIEKEEEELRIEYEKYDLDKINEQINTVELKDGKVEGKNIDIVSSIVFGIFLILFLIQNNYIYLIISLISLFVLLINLFSKRRNKVKGRDNDKAIKVLLDIKNKAEEVGNKLIKIRSERDGMLFGLDMSKYEDELRKLYQDKRGLEIDELSKDNLVYEIDPKDYFIKKKELLDTEKKIGSAKLMIIKLEANVELAQVSGEDIRGLEERLVYLKEELKYNEKMAQVYELMIQGFEYSLKETARDFKHSAKEFVENKIKIITNGRYDKVEIEDDLGLKVYSSEKGDWVSPKGELSSGTIDEIYFVFRLAFLRLLGKKDKLPLILDDPFVTFDKNRLDKTRKILESLEDQQILLFTHNTNYKDWGKLIELPSS